MVLVIIKALDILELIAQEQDRAFTLTEISEKLNLHQATCANILKTLVSKNYVEHKGRKKGYKLGSMAYHLTNSNSLNQALVAAARDSMDVLTKQLNESSLLGIIRNQKRYILHMVNSDQDLHVRSRSERNVYETASGRLLLANLPETDRKRFLKANGLPDPAIWKEATSYEELMGNLDKIKNDGLALTLDVVKHIVGLAVPVYKGERVVAALSVFLPEARFSTSRKKLLIQALRTTADQISAKLN